MRHELNLIRRQAFFPNGCSIEDTHTGIRHVYPAPRIDPWLMHQYDFTIAGLDVDSYEYTQAIVTTVDKVDYTPQWHTDDIMMPQLEFHGFGYVEGVPGRIECNFSECHIVLIRKKVMNGYTKKEKHPEGTVLTADLSGTL